MPPREATGWRNHRRWALPVIIVLGAGLLLLGFVAAIFFATYSLMRSSDPITVSIAVAQRDAAVVAALGEPIDAEGMPTGSIEVTEERGRARLETTLTGPRASATLKVRARRADGRWTYQRVVVTTKRGREIDLTDAVNAAQAAVATGHATVAPDAGRD